MKTIAMFNHNGEQYFIDHDNLEKFPYSVFKDTIKLKKSKTLSGVMKFIFTKIGNTFKTL